MLAPRLPARDGRRRRLGDRSRRRRRASRIVDALRALPRPAGRRLRARRLAVRRPGAAVRARRRRAADARARGDRHAARRRRSTAGRRRTARTSTIGPRELVWLGAATVDVGRRRCRPEGDCDELGPRRPAQGPRHGARRGRRRARAAAARARRARRSRREVAERIDAYTPEWTDRRRDDAGVALVRAYGTVAEAVDVRLNRTPRKLALEQLDARRRSRAAGTRGAGDRSAIEVAPRARGAARRARRQRVPRVGRREPGRHRDAAELPGACPARSPRWPSPPTAGSSTTVPRRSAGSPRSARARACRRSSGSGSSPPSRPSALLSIAVELVAAPDRATFARDRDRAARDRRRRCAGRR